MTGPVPEPRAWISPSIPYLCRHCLTFHLHSPRPCQHRFLSKKHITIFSTFLTSGLWIFLAPLTYLSTIAYPILRSTYIDFFTPRQHRRSRLGDNWSAPTFNCDTTALSAVPEASRILSPVFPQYLDTLLGHQRHRYPGLPLPSP
jgi:hypothetical protein